MLVWTVVSDASNSTSAQAIRIARAFSARSSGWSSRFECACIRGQGKSIATRFERGGDGDGATARQRDGGGGCQNKRSVRDAYYALASVCIRKYVLVPGMCRTGRITPLFLYVLQNVFHFTALRYDFAADVLEQQLQQQGRPAEHANVTPGQVDSTIKYCLPLSLIHI